MLHIDGLQGVVEIIQAERDAALREIERAITLKTKDRLTGRVEMANTLLAYLTGDVALIATGRDGQKVRSVR